MSNKIAVQVIRTPGRDEFFAECMKSLGDEPVDVIVDSFGPHLTTRLNFIDAAVADYVSFVDDDLVVPGIYQKLLTEAESEQDVAVGAHSHEVFISETGEVLNHHVNFNHSFDVTRQMQLFHFPRAWILRTDVAKEVSKFLRSQPEMVQKYLYPEFTIAALAGSVGKWIELPEVGYKYRRHTGNSINTLPHSWFKNQTRQLIRGVYASLEPEGQSDTKDQAK